MSEVRLILGDCRDFMHEVGHVDAIVTDPPYGMDWDTDSTRFSFTSDLRSGNGRSDWGRIQGDDQPFDPTPWLAFPKVVLWGWNHYSACIPRGTTLVWVKKADHLYGTFLSDAEIGWMKGGHGVYCFSKQFPPPSRMKEALGCVAHPNQKPVALMRWCIEKLKLNPDATIWDPYMGSGSTGVAAIQLGYHFVGTEMHERYFRIAQRRIAVARRVIPLFY